VAPCCQIKQSFFLFPATEYKQKTYREMGINPKSNIIAGTNIIFKQIHRCKRVRPEHQNGAFQVFFWQPHEQQRTPLKQSFSPKFHQNQQFKD
jgi:hypothetical protein